MLNDPLFNAIWETIKRWDIGTPHYGGYCGATGNHVRAILDGLAPALLAERAEMIEALEEIEAHAPDNATASRARAALTRARGGGRSRRAESP